MRMTTFAVFGALAVAAASPALASPSAVNPAAGLSLSNPPQVRSGATTARASHLTGGELAAAVGALAIGAAAIILATTDKSHPRSP